MRPDDKQTIRVEALPTVEQVLLDCLRLRQWYKAVHSCCTCNYIICSSSRSFLRGFKVGIEDTVRTRKAKLVDDKVKWKEERRGKKKDYSPVHVTWYDKIYFMKIKQVLDNNLHRYSFWSDTMHSVWIYIRLVEQNNEPRSNRSINSCQVLL